MPADKALTPAAAYDALYESVYIPTFFAKLASYQISPANEDEAQRLLTMGHQLMQAEQAEQQKQASAHSSLLVAASDSLSEQLGYGRKAQYKAAEADWAKQATAEFIKDENVLAAAKALSRAVTAANS